MDLTIAEQIALIAQDGAAEFRVALMWACLAALSLGAVAGIVYASRDTISRACRMILFLGPVGCMLVGPFVSKMIAYGSTKPTPDHLWRFQFENGLHDMGSYCTNDVIHAEWDYAPVLDGYALRATYRDLTITNEVGVCIDAWHYLENADVSDMVAEWFVPDATNMEVVCYVLYVPPVHVVTNGVYHVSGVMRTLATTNSAAPSYVTPGIRVYALDDEGEANVLTPTNEPPQSILGDLLNDTNDN